MKEYFERLYKGDCASFYELLKKALTENEKKFVVTANPEAFMYGKNDSEVHALLSDEEVAVVADGIGIVKGAAIAGINLPERIPGVDIAKQLFEFGNQLSSSVYLFGSKQEVIDAMLEVLKKDYPNLKIAGTQNGYVADKDAVFEEIKQVKPDIVLVALGIPAQEKLIYKHLKDFEKGIFVGVGGSLDVLSGTKKRAPEFFINHNIEWLYRIAKEPKRIKRFINNNIKFFIDLKKELKTK